MVKIIDIILNIKKQKLSYADLRAAEDGRGDGCRLCGGGALCAAGISSPFSSVLRSSFGKQYNSEEVRNDLEGAK